MTPEASHAEMLGVLSRYITRPLRNDGKWDTVLQLLQDLTVAVLFMGDKLDDPAEARLEAMTQRIKLELQIQLKRRAPEPVADPAFNSGNVSPEQFIPGIDYPEQPAAATFSGGISFSFGSRTLAGGGTSLVKTGAYRTRCGEFVQVHRTAGAERATDGRRSWMPGGYFFASHQEDDRDLVQEIIMHGGGNA